MKKLYLLLLSLSIWGLHLSAQTDTKIIADSLYAQNKYKEAAALYEEMLNQGDNAILYYNLGNAYYRMDDLAHAILNYERAVQREPGDGDIRFNLTLARSKTVDKIQSTDDFFLLYWFRSFVNMLNTDQWGRLSIFMFLITLFGGLCYFFAHRLLWRKIGFGVGLAAFGLVILFNLFAYMQRRQYLDATHAIVMKSATVKSTPADSGTAIFELHEGTKVKLLDTSMREWTEIRLSDGKSGWISKNSIEII